MDAGVPLLYCSPAAFTTQLQITTSTAISVLNNEAMTVWTSDQKYESIYERL